TGDPSSYPAAEEAFRQAAQRSPDDPLVLVGQTGLQLARHEFATALETGTAAMKAAPGNRAAQAVVVDALVELGRYDEAIKVAAMLLEADSLPAWNRTSYLRELHGDLKGALKAMEEAAVRGGGVSENEAFTFTLVGNLNAALGRQDRATIVYDKALALFPNYGPAIAGKARLAIAQGDLAEGVRLFEKAVAILPLPEYVIALGEAQEASGDLEAARRSYDLATFQVKLFQANGVVVDVELALFEADHGAADKALEYARASYENRQNVKTADTLAWALYRNGDLDGAAKYSAEALRLGSKDPILLYHAGAIAAARGDKATARKQLEGALAIDAGFSATGAEHARSILEGLD
ncbi:MAG: tetratricopeptide repeat protein, partial [Gemmatimonadaceae bacterium]